MAGRVDAVVFDLGRVLIGVDTGALAARLAAHTTRSAQDMLRTPEARALAEAYETGRTETDAFCRDMISALGLDLGPEDFARVWTGIFTRWPDMEALFAEVRARAAVAILSDTNPLHWRAIQALAPPLAAPDAVGLSYRIGACKPDPATYAAVVRALGAAPERCVFVDDLDANVRGARRAGMRAFRHTDARASRERLLDMLGDG